MADAKQIARQPVEDQPARRPQEHHREDDGHEHHHLLLFRARSAGRLQPLLVDHRRSHDQRRDVERILHRQVVDPPHERRASQLDRHRQQSVEGNQDRHRHQHRQAPARGVRAVAAIQLHHLLVHLLLGRIGRLQIGVPRLDRLHFRLQLLHLPHGHDALVA